MSVTSMVIFRISWIFLGVEKPKGPLKKQNVTLEFILKQRVDSNSLFRVHDLFIDFDVTTVGNPYDGILCLRFEQIHARYVFHTCVCFVYLPSDK
jgi:hypothetical protein